MELKPAWFTSSNLISCHFVECCRYLNAIDHQYREQFFVEIDEEGLPDYLPRTMTPCTECIRLTHEKEERMLKRFWRSSTGKLPSRIRYFLSFEWT